MSTWKSRFAAVMKRNSSSIVTWLLLASAIRMRASPKANQSMIAFMPGAISIQVVPWVGAVAAFLAARSRHAWVRLVNLVTMALALAMFKSQVDSRLLFAQALKDMGVNHPKVAGHKVGAMSVQRMASALLVPFLYWVPMVLAHFDESAGVRVVSGVQYGKAGGKKLVLDLLYSLSRDRNNDTVVGDGTTLPVFVYVHGGGWVTGTRKLHGIPMLMSLVRAGWAVVSIDYRLAPEASLSEMLMDCKRALAWVRPNLTRVIKEDIDKLSSATDSIAWTGQVPATVLAASSQGKACPMVVTVGGESAGGHLSAVLGLTANEPQWQPVPDGRQLAAARAASVDVTDTSVEAVVDLFGVHDIMDEGHHFYSMDNGGFRLYTEWLVKGSMAKKRHVFESLSPLSLIKRAAAAVEDEEEKNGWSQRLPPPFLGIHGTHDSLVPVKEAAMFYRELKSTRSVLNKRHGVDTRDAHVQVPFAPHAFNMTLNPWTYACNDAVVAFLHDQYGRCVARRIVAAKTISSTGSDGILLSNPEVTDSRQEEEMLVVQGEMFDGTSAAAAAEHGLNSQDQVVVEVVQDEDPHNSKL